MAKFDETYQNLIRNIMENGIEEMNFRTGHKTKSLPGLTFSIDVIQDGFPVLTLREQPLKSPIAEQVWFLQGEKDTEFLRRYTKMWDKFIEDDGTLEAAYGFRWRKRFGRDQLGEAIELLKRDPSSRQAVIVTWDPSDDGLLAKSKKNVPCPYTFTLNIIGGRLHLHNIVRSNDMMLGCPFDVFGFVLLQCMIAQELGVRPGIYTHSISNAHIYDTHYKAANEIISRENLHGKITLNLPMLSLQRAVEKDENLVDEIYKQLREQYYPLPKINGLNIIQ